MDMRVGVDGDPPSTIPTWSLLRANHLSTKTTVQLNPTVIVEVLSPSTEADDRGRKFANYRRLESLRSTCLLGSATQSLAERYSRQGDEWLLTVWTRPEDVLMLESIGCAVPLKEIYAKVPLPSASQKVFEK